MTTPADVGSTPTGFAGLNSLVSRVETDFTTPPVVLRDDVELEQGKLEGAATEGARVTVSPGLLAKYRDYILVLGFVVVVALGYLGYFQYESSKQAARATGEVPVIPFPALPEPKPAPAVLDPYVSRVQALQDKVRLGEITALSGRTTREPPGNLMQWSALDVRALELAQTWWRSSELIFHVHLNNTTRSPLSVVAMEYSPQRCTNRVDSQRFYLWLEQPIAPGAQSVATLNPGIAPSLAPQGQCLDIVAAWSDRLLMAAAQPPSPTMAPPPVRGSPPTIQVSPSRPAGLERTFTKQEQADLDRVLQRAFSDFPFLATPEGRPVLDKIIARRNALMLLGAYPSIALTQAVNEDAPAYAAAFARAQERAGPATASQKTEVDRPASYNSFPAACRWVSSQEWSCK
jgi:hypothetical protein